MMLHARSLCRLPLALSLLGATPLSAAGSDPKATAIADQVMTALGGQAAWDGTHYLRFDFAVEKGGKQVVSRAHTWDKWSGRYRLEAKSKEGDPLLVLMNINTKEGTAWKKGVKLEGEEAKKQLEQAYGIWVNDTYWLIMPYKMKDPGVILALDGEEKTAAGAWDKVRLTFDNVGLTPKDKYWAFVNRSTHLVDRWDFILAGGPGPANTWDWKNWSKYGHVMFANDRVSPKDGGRIYFPVLDVPESIPDAAFTSPEAAASK